MILREDTEIAASPQVVWNAIHDYRFRMEWDSMLRRLAVNGRPPAEAEPIQVGSEITQWARWQGGGVCLRARYTECSPPTATADGIAAVTMTGGPWFFKSFEARSVLKRTADCQTRCEATYHIECWPRLLRYPVERGVRFLFARETTFRWRSLKAYLEQQDRATADYASSEFTSVVTCETLMIPVSTPPISSSRG